MSSSPNVFQIGLKLALIVLIFYSLALLFPSISGGERGKKMRIVLGSSPPKCVGRCLGCRPCVASLVIPPHKYGYFGKLLTRPSSYDAKDESYYLLSWKCKCGNKYFQP